MSAEQSRAREEICRVGKSLFDRGYAHATAGNISIKLDDGFLITPTDACLGFLDPARLALLDEKGHQLSGDRASKTIALHAGIYRATAPFDVKAQCVIHTHSTHCVALTLKPFGEELLPAVTPYFVMKVGRVPVIAYQSPGSPVAAQAVEKAIGLYGQRGLPIRAVMLARLGPSVWHKSASAAMATLEELEETARLTMIHGAAIEPLEEAQIEDLRLTFGARW